MCIRDSLKARRTLFTSFGLNEFDERVLNLEQASAFFLKLFGENSGKIFAAMERLRLGLKPADRKGDRVPVAMIVDAALGDIAEFAPVQTQQVEEPKPAKQAPPRPVVQRNVDALLGASKTSPQKPSQPQKTDTSRAPSIGILTDAVLRLAAEYSTLYHFTVALRQHFIDLVSLVQTHALELFVSLDSVWLNRIWNYKLEPSQVVPDLRSKGVLPREEGAGILEVARGKRFHEEEFYRKIKGFRYGEEPFGFKMNEIQYREYNPVILLRDVKITKTEVQELKTAAMLNGYQPDKPLPALLPNFVTVEEEIGKVERGASKAELECVEDLRSIDRRVLQLRKGDKLRRLGELQGWLLVENPASNSFGFVPPSYTIPKPS
eukprot:TRINITY_DN3448_c0_g1_i3.p1 TRINITY_DN3448_c0_g1~~TRINITY_DN3448_c0_g1_i3.p1  ORF type:complete len:377 (+),score=69.63 TRINITY_DN3448_c0_g1_i3:65-1195(+)